MRLTRDIRCLLALSLTLGCGQDGQPVAPSPLPPHAQIVDGGHNGGNSHFYFLAPMVRPSPRPAGTLDADLLPHLAVTICEVDAAGQCVEEVVTFTAEGRGPARLRVEADEQPHFHVNWQTREYQLDPASDYRITVLAAGTELGHADVDLVSHPRGLDGVAAGWVGVVNGQTRPIKFLVLKGGVFVIGSAGGTITAFDGAVTLDVPAGALGENTGITIDRASELPPFDGGFVVDGSGYDFGPDGLTFDRPAQLTIAYDEALLPAGREEHELALLHLVDGIWHGVGGSTVVVEDGTVRAVGRSVDPENNVVTGLISGFSPYAPGGGIVVTLSGSGTAVIDGTMNAMEWVDADCRTFPATLPDGSTTSAKLCVMNDATQLYVGVTFAQNVVTLNDVLGLGFDNLDDGRTVGDDHVFAGFPSAAANVMFWDQFVTTQPNCQLCTTLDSDDGGTTDGAAAFKNSNGVSTYEVSHPLNTSDNAHDFSLDAGDVVGFEVTIGVGVHDFPAAQNHGHILIKAGIDQQQPTMDAAAGFNLAIGGNSEQMLAQVVIAGVSGKLAQVKLPVTCSGGFLIVEIQGVTNGVPNGTVLASQSVPAASLSSFFSTLAAFPAIAFTTPATLTAGQQFAIVLKNTTVGESCGLIPGPVGNPYAGGDGWFDARPNPVGVWESLSIGHGRADLPFQTVVQ